MSTFKREPIARNQSNESVAKRAGGKVGETLTDFATRVGQGVDKRLVEKYVVDIKK